MSDKSRETGKLFLQMLDAIRTCEPGPGRSDLRGRFDKMMDRYRSLPDRVAMQAPFADRDDAASVLRTEMEWVFSAWEENS